MPYKVGEIVRRVQTQEFPPGTETPKRLLELWNATMQVWERVKDEINDAGGAPSQLAEDVAQFELRMQEYRGQIQAQIAKGNGDNAAGRNALLLDVINGGFLLNPIDPNTGLRIDGPHVPDFATPFVFANQNEVLQDFRGENLDQFFRDAAEEYKRLGDDITHRVQAANEYVEEQLTKFGEDVSETFTPKIRVDLSSVLIIGGLGLLFVLSRRK